MSKHLVHMNRAYELAMKGWGRVSPNPMVGAVVVNGGEIVGEGWHAFCGGPHAEIDAFSKAGKKTKGADLYVTLEPCSHFGRTPPCTQAILAAGIRRVFVGVLDPNPLMKGKSVRFLRQAGVEVEVGFLEAELTRLNEAFNKYITTGLPFVTAKIAQTLDGKIADLKGESKWITSQEARDYAHDLRFGFDAILVGINTVIKDNPGLNTTPFKPIKKIILDANLRTPAKAKLLHGCDAQDVWIFTTVKAPKNFPATVVEAPARNGRMDLKWVFKYVGRQEISHVLIEGGGKVIGNALSRGLVDKMMIYTAPKIMGDGLEAIRGLSAAKFKDILQLKDVTMGRLGPDILMEGYL